MAKSNKLETVEKSEPLTGTCKYEITEFPEVVHVHETVTCVYPDLINAGGFFLVPRSVWGTRGITMLPSFMRRSECHRYCIVTPSHMKHYVENNAFEPDYGNLYVPDEEMLDWLKKGRFDLVVHDMSSDDGYFYDLNGNPVYRWFHVDSLTSGRYRFQPLLQHLKELHRLKRISKPVVEFVPSYNASFSGEQEVSFYAKPQSPATFRRWYKVDQEQGGFDVDRAVCRHLEIDRFEMTEKQANALRHGNYECDE